MNVTPTYNTNATKLTSVEKVIKVDEQVIPTDDSNETSDLTQEADTYLFTPLIILEAQASNYEDD